MSKVDPSLQELFIKLGRTPAERSAKASSVFRQLRADGEHDLLKSMLGAPARLDLSEHAKKSAATKEASEADQD
ncbi:MAG: hypothetical protein AAFR21_12980 [Pseudomonadota bacterium]